MKLRSYLVLLVLALVLPANAFAGDVTGAAETAIDLRLELLEVQAREVELQIRLQQLDEEIKPENIEHALAGIGSTRPEDLREHRHRLLTIERNGVLSQLRLVKQGRERLETAITTAEAGAYMESAQPPATTSDQLTRAKASRWLLPSPAAPDCNDLANRSNEPGVGQVLSSDPRECRATGIPLPLN